MKKTIKKKNPQDSTSRNVRAGNRKIAALRERVSKLEVMVAFINLELAGMRGLKKLAKPK